MATSDGTRRRLTRLLAGLGVAAGAALLARPQRVVVRICPEFPASRLWMVRLLGARLVLQHGAVLTLPDPRLVSAGSAVDLLHATTMLPFLAARRYRRAALVSGSLATAYAALGAVAAPHSEGGR
jgi:hypothetical protein